MDFICSELSSDSGSDCEDEYNEFCKTNAGMNGFIYQQMLILSRLKELERSVQIQRNVVDNLSYTLERIIDMLLAIIKIKGNDKWNEKIAKT
jgi:hypothetical protein